MADLDLHGKKKERMGWRGWTGSVSSSGGKWSPAPCDGQAPCAVVRELCPCSCNAWASPIDVPAASTGVSQSILITSRAHWLRVSCLSPSELASNCTCSLGPQSGPCWMVQSSDIWFDLILHREEWGSRSTGCPARAAASASRCPSLPRLCPLP